MNERKLAEDIVKETQANPAPHKPGKEMDSNASLGVYRQCAYPQVFLCGLASGLEYKTVDVLDFKNPDYVDPDLVEVFPYKGQEAESAVFTKLMKAASEAAKTRLIHDGEIEEEKAELYASRIFIGGEELGFRAGLAATKTDCEALFHYAADAVKRIKNGESSLEDVKNEPLPQIFFPFDTQKVPQWERRKSVIAGECGPAEYFTPFLCSLMADLYISYNIAPPQREGDMYNLRFDCNPADEAKISAFKEAVEEVTSAIDAALINYGVTEAELEKAKGIRIIGNEFYDFGRGREDVVPLRIPIDWEGISRRAKEKASLSKDTDELEI